jgi:hypothetical protein
MSALSPRRQIAYPIEAFMFAANPGNRWRTPFDPSSAMPVLRRRDSLRGLVRR